jgi:predicted RNA binding protein YcfA (HicA-like mRNA interferase family)
MKVRDVIKLLESNGWQLARMRGSHRQFKHTTNKNVITVSGAPSQDMKQGTLNDILKKAGLK